MAQHPLEPGISPSPNAVFVTYGVYQMHLELAGRTLAEVRQSLAGPLNIDPRSVAVVNGETVAETTTLRGGDRVEFVRLAGQKGSSTGECTRGVVGARCNVPLPRGVGCPHTPPN